MIPLPIQKGFTSYTYDNAMQVVSATNRLKNNTAISQYSYQYDKLGNQIKKTDNGQITQYTYDANNRLQQERRHIGGTGDDYSGLLEVVRQYAYDGNGTEKNSDETDINPFRYCGEYYDCSLSK